MTTRKINFFSHSVTNFLTVSCQKNSFLVLFGDNFSFYFIHSIQLEKDCQKLHFAAKRFCKKFLLPTIYHDFRPIGKNIQVGMGAVGRGGGGKCRQNTRAKGWEYLECLIEKKNWIDWFVSRTLTNISFNFYKVPVDLSTKK